jgi:hypothetical protein
VPVAVELAGAPALADSEFAAVLELETWFLVIVESTAEGGPSW